MNPSVYSITDWNGKIFYDNDNVYRMVTTPYFERIIKPLLDDKEFLEKCFEVGLVRFELADKKYDFNILKLEPIYSFSFMKHRSVAQVLDTLKTFVKLAKVLGKKELLPVNFHDGDMPMCGCMPKFIDLGTIDTLSPLRMMFMFDRIAWLYGKCVLKLGVGLVEHVTHHIVIDKYPDIFQKYHRILTPPDTPELNLMTLTINKDDLLDKMYKYFDNYKVNPQPKWCEYQEHFEEIETMVSANNLNPKEKSIYELLDKCKSNHKTLFDVGCNKGQNSMMGALLGYNVFGCDSDEYSIYEGYSFAKTHPIFKDKVHFLNCNLDDLFVQNEENEELKYIPPCNRYKSDLVLCSAFMHHWKQPLELLIEHLSELTLKTLISEYVPMTIVGAGKNKIIECLENNDFHIVETKPSNEKGREFWLLKRKNNYERLV